MFNATWWRICRLRNKTYWIYERWRRNHKTPSETEEVSDSKILEHCSEKARFFPKLEAFHFYKKWSLSAFAVIKLPDIFPHARFFLIRFFLYRWPTVAVRLSVIYVSQYLCCALFPSRRQWGQQQWHSSPVSDGRRRSQHWGHHLTSSLPLSQRGQHPAGGAERAQGGGGPAQWQGQRQRLDIPSLYASMLEIMTWKRVLKAGTVFDLLV